MAKENRIAILAFGVILSAVSARPVRPATAPPSQLRCEYLVNPIAIDVARPRFQWVFDSSARGVMQTAYQVLVATSPARLARDEGDAWDSGKTLSGDSTQVVYAGKPLQSGQVYYWKARIWENHGEATAYSEPATFGMGLLSASDWHGEWVGGGNELRREFRLDAPVESARAYICGLGYSELRINGKRIGHRVLDPAWTVYTKRVLYSTYDVTANLREGRNAIGVMLGQGWYKSRALMFELDIVLAGGKEVHIASDTLWKVHNGPIVRDSVYNGEVYDARLETPGWDQPGFTDSKWAAAQPVKAPGGVLSAEMLPPIRVTETIAPKSMTNPAPGVYVYDMGQNFSGWAELRVRGPRGARVEMRYAEVLYPDGMINRDNLRQAKARDVYILKGGGLETYEPHFTYHGFRYVELTGFPGTPNLNSIRGRFLHSAVPATGGFAASKEILNQIQHLIYWGQLSNLFSIPTDCDQRNERQGWMGDAQVSSREAMMNFDMAAFYTNFVRDIHDAQLSDGEVPDTVPHIYGQYPADPAWGSAYPVITWGMWRQYGDRRILKQQYNGVKKWVDYLRSRAQGNVLSYSSYGDWVAIDPTPRPLVSDAYYYADVRILEGMARVLGKTSDAKADAQLASAIRQAFNATFFDKSAYDYANGSQTAQAMALDLGLVPKRAVPGVMFHLTSNIVYGHDTHLTTGFIGVRFLLPALTKFGRADLAYELAVRKTYPSWGYMIARGATTLWEIWQNEVGPKMNSHNHIMFGSVGAWFYQTLGGIRQTASSGGYDHLHIAPAVVEDLRWVSASLETPHGLAASSWRHRPGDITLRVTIPTNSDATVVIPPSVQMTPQQVVVREGGHVVWQDAHYVPGDPGISGATATADGIEFQTGSGQYAFQLTATPAQ